MYGYIHNENDTAIVQNQPLLLFQSDKFPNDAFRVYYFPKLNAIEIYFVLMNIDEEEKRNFEKSPFLFKLWKKNKVIYLLCKVGSNNWSDSSFTWHLIGERYRSIPDLKDGKDLLVTAILVERKNRNVEIIRQLQLSSDFSIRWKKEMIKQSKKKFNPDKEERWSNEIANNNIPEQLASSKYIIANTQGIEKGTFNLYFSCFGS